MIATIEHYDKVFMAVSFDYDESFIAELKSSIPGRNRRWLPEERIWLVHHIHGDRLRFLLSKHGYQVIDPLSVGKTLVAGGIFSDLFANTPPTLRHRLFRNLVLVFHPDAGGTDSMMQSLNAAWDQWHDKS